MTMTVNADKIIFFTMVFLRISSIVMTAPLLGSPSVPIRIKLALGLILTIVMYPLAEGHGSIEQRDIVSLTFAAGKELLIGITIGFMANLVFAGINLAGQLMGFQMGFAIVNVIDPLYQAQVSIVSHFIGFLAIILFVTLNGHYLFIQAISDSFSLVEIGTAKFGGLIVKDIMQAASELFVIGLKVGAPVCAIILFTNVGLGIVARTVPQMNVFIVGFPLTIGMGLIALGITFPLFLELMKSSFNGMGRGIYSLLKGMQV